MMHRSPVRALARGIEAIGVRLLVLAACGERAAPATTAEPALAAPRTVEPNPPSPSPPPAAVKPPATTDAKACDPSGTWEIEVVAHEDGCPSMREDKLELALGFVAGAEGATLRGAARAVGEAGTLASMREALQVGRVVGPAPACGVRLRLGAPAEAHAELLLGLEGDALTGQGALWDHHGGKPCSRLFSAFGRRTAPQPANWATLGEPATPPELAQPGPAGAPLVAAVERLAVKALLAGMKAKRSTVPLRGSPADYVAGFVEGRAHVRLLEVACTVSAGRCVAIVGEACGPAGGDEDCEGMSLTLVVDPRTGELDRADAGSYPVESQADVEALAEMAP